MVIWFKVKWIDPLFAALNAIAPNRAHGQDGTIGDAAHQAETSGHNPDDTPGVSAERQDADTKPEVRAADADSDFREPDVTMEKVIQATLVECRAGRETRFIYIIYNRRIWRAANGWKQETYTGSDPHDRHAHFSGHPDGDENATPFTYITKLGAQMEQKDPVEGNKARTTVGNTFADLGNQRDWEYNPPGTPGNNPPPDGSRADIAFKAAQSMPVALAKVQASVDAIQAGQVSQEVVTAAVVAALQTPEVLALLVAATKRGADLAEDS